MRKAKTGREWRLWGRGMWLSFLTATILDKIDGKFEPSLPEARFQFYNRGYSDDFIGALPYRGLMNIHKAQAGVIKVTLKSASLLYSDLKVADVLYESASLLTI